MSKRDEKRERVLGHGHAGRRPAGKKWVAPAVLGALFLAVLAAGLVQNTSRPAGPKISTAQVEAVDYSSNDRVEQTPIQVVQAGGSISVPLAEVKAKRLVGFTYNGPDKTLPLLAYITPSGKVMTAVSMCEPCNSTTFHIEGDQLVCNACGTRWTLEDLQGIAGGCLNYPPDPFPNALSGDQVVIQEASVASWTPRV